MSRRERRTLLLAIAALLSVIACRENARERAGADARRLAEGARVARTDVVRALASPDTVGRLIYDAPTDLSHPFAGATRPDLVPRDTARR